MANDAIVRTPGGPGPPSRRISTGFDPGRSGTRHVVLDAVADVDCLVRVRPRERERVLEDRHAGLADADRGRGHDRVQQRGQPDSREHLHQRDVPVGHHDHALPLGAGAFERRQSVVERAELQRGQQRLGELLGRHARQSPAGRQPRAQRLRAASAQISQRDRVAALVEVRAVVGDLSGDRVARPGLADVHAKPSRELGPQPRGGIVEAQQRPECVDQQHAHATNRQVANSAVNRPSSTAIDANAGWVRRRRSSQVAAHMKIGNSTTS